MVNIRGDKNQVSAKKLTFLKNRGILLPGVPMKIRFLPLFFLVFISFSHSQGVEVPTSLASATWLNHIEKDLIPFWITPDALGLPVGNLSLIHI